MTDTESIVRQMLQLSASTDELPVRVPRTAADIRASRSRRRTTAAGVVLVAAVVVAIAIVTVSLNRTGARPAATAPVVSSQVSAAQLADATWHPIPAAPISARGDGASAWTGSEMITWGGGLPNAEYFGDGAAYDPVAGTWRTLPPAPLTARTSPASTWTGRQLFVWGGVDSAGFDSNGATYTPATNTWQSLPALAVRDPLFHRAVWTGDAVVLLTADGATSAVGVHGWDPNRDVWTALPSITEPAGRHFMQIEAIAAGSRVYAWVTWNYDARTATGGTEQYGTDGFALESDATSWQRVTSGSDWPGNTAPLWTGSRILLPAARTFCSACDDDPRLHSSPVALDYATGDAAQIANGPLDGNTPDYVWTGNAMVAFDAPDSLAARAGAAALWNGDTDSWSNLPSTGMNNIGQPATAWTGSELIEWGAFDTANSTQNVMPTGFALSA